jgi:hypothetical protein
MCVYRSRIVRYIFILTDDDDDGYDDDDDDYDRDDDSVDTDYDSVYDSDY